MRIGIDCETRGRVELKQVAADRYAKDRSTQATMWAVKAEDWPRAVVFEGMRLERILAELKRSKQIVWSAAEPLELIHWSGFDRLIARYCEGWESPEWAISAGATPGWLGPASTVWIDLAAFSRTFGAPGGLDQAGAFWVGEQKDPGKGFIARFCKPQKNGRFIEPAEDPTRWERFKSYAGQDVDLMMAVHDAIAGLEGRHTLAEHWPAMAMVERMNRRGLPIDRASARAALDQIELAEAAAVARCEQLFGFKPSQTEKVRAFLDLPNVQKATLEAALLEELSAERQTLIELRLQTSGAARKKLVPMLGRTSEDDPRARDAFLYHGAWTRRMTSVGIQAQNFVRGETDYGFFEDLEEQDIEEEPEDFFEQEQPTDPAFFEQLGKAQGAAVPVPGIFERTRQNIRGFICAPEGRTLVAADYSAIELRVGAWLATEWWVLEALTAGRKLYAEVAGSILGLPWEECVKGSWRYDFGKMVALACIYQLGGPMLHRRCELAGIEIEEDFAIGAVAKYRQDHPAIKRAWEECHGLFSDLVDAGSGTAYYGLGGRVRFERWPYFIKIVRPSGFAQYFFGPRHVEGAWPDGTPRLELSYLGRGDYGGMKMRHTYGGKIFQGITQGTAADLMYHGMAQAERAGFPPIMSVHDEIVCEIMDDGRDWSPRLCEVIAQKPTWAEGLPVIAEGWQGRRFTK